MQVHTEMKRSKRGKLIQVREPNGRHARTDDLKEFAPVQVKRLRDAALSGMADAEWGTVVGQLFLAGKVNGAMYAAAKRWAERAARYHEALGAPPPDPKAITIERRESSAAVDPDSPEGQQRAERDLAAITDFMAAHSVLCAAGMMAEMVVRAACERDRRPECLLEAQELNRGLLWLAEHWGLTNQEKRNVR